MKIKELSVFVLLMLFVINNANSQTESSNNESLSRFRIGLSYEYLSLKLKVMSIKYHSVWEGQDFGTSELGDDEVSEVNSISDISKIVHGPLINAGYTILNKKENPLFIEINAVAGMAFKNHEIINTETNKVVQSIKSDKYNHWYGLGMELRYHINKTWGVQLTPSLNYSYGVSENIIDKITPAIINYSEERSIKSNILYARTQLMVVYTLNNLSFLAGPGFYFASNMHELTVERTNLEDNTINIDIYTTKLQSVQFVDLNLGLNWHFMKHFSFNATGGIGNGYFVFSGISYLF
jgi:hypothetical protein